MAWGPLEALDADLVTYTSPFSVDECIDRILNNISASAARPKFDTIVEYPRGWAGYVGESTFTLHPLTPFVAGRDAYPQVQGRLTSTEHGVQIRLIIYPDPRLGQVYGGMALVVLGLLAVGIVRLTTEGITKDVLAICLGSFFMFGFVAWNMYGVLRVRRTCIESLAELLDASPRRTDMSSGVER